jgi:hypothetical protein
MEIVLSEKDNSKSGSECGERVLYRYGDLAAVLAEVPKDTRIIIARDKQSVDVLLRHGIPATMLLLPSWKKLGAEGWDAVQALLEDRQLTLLYSSGDYSYQRRLVRIACYELPHIASSVKLLDCLAVREENVDRFRRHAREKLQDCDVVDDDLESFTAEDLRDEYREMRPVVIDGLLRCGETMNLVSATKKNKSWLLISLALSIAAGRPWLGRFKTTAGRVLLIDNELHEETYSDRLYRVANEMGIDWDEVAPKVTVINFRGRLVETEQDPRTGKARKRYLDIMRLRKKLHAAYRPTEFSFVGIDALYRFFPLGTSENDNGAIARVYNELDGLARGLHCGIACVHHSTKGDQSGKAVVDVGSGASAQARSVDAHVVLREHTEDDAVVLEAALRSFPPVEPLTLRWKFPLWTPAEELNPDNLRNPRQVAQDRQKAGSEMKVLAAIAELDPAAAGVAISHVAKQAGIKFETVDAAVGRLALKGLANRCTVVVLKRGRRNEAQGVRLVPTGKGKSVCNSRHSSQPKP